MPTKHQQIIDLVKKISGQKQTLTLPRIYIKITGDTLAGMLLSEIVWCSDTSSRKDGWFWKKSEDWKEELELSYAQVKRLAKKLEDAGFIETRLMKAQGAPTMHYRPLMDNITTSILDFLENRESSNSTNDKMENEESSESMDFQESEESITTPPTQSTTPLQATPVADATPINLDQWLERIRGRKKNRQAELVFMHETLYPDRSAPDFGYVAKIARQVGGASVLADYLWRFSPPRVRPYGDVLAYILKVHKGNSTNGKKHPSIQQNLDAVDEWLEATDGKP